MSDALRLRADLATMLADKGQVVTITRTTPGTYDVDTGIAASSSASYTGRGRVGSYDDRLIDGVRVLQTDRRITWQPDAAYASFRPRESDTIAYGNSTLSVVSVKERELGGVWFSYTLQCRI